MEIHRMSAVVLARHIRDRELTAEDALEHFIKRVEHIDGALNAVVVRRYEQARARARKADEALSRGEIWGPLHGVPMTIKETFELTGWPTTAGARKLRQHVSTLTSPVVQRLLNAGVVIFGKTNVPLYAGDIQTYNDIYGTTNNPWDTTRTPGGSSGGAAAAVAAGLTSLELGSDIGGSIRTPAAFCGVFGLKPSWGISSLRGHIPGPPGSLSRTDIAVSGPLARSVDDLELGLDILAGPDDEDAPGWKLELPGPRHQTARDFRVAAWLDDPRCDVDSQIRAALQSLTGRLAEQGMRVNADARPEVSLTEAYDLYYTLLAGTMGAGLPPELYQRMAEDTAKPEGNEDYAARFAQGATQSHADWLRANEQRARQRRAWHRFFRHYDVLLCPVVQTLPFTHRQEPAPYDRTLTVNGREQPYMDLLVWAGLCGAVYLPAATVPIGISKDGLPLAVQVIGPYLEDRTVLAFARHLETMTESIRCPLS